jgi:hypothetical protein
MVRYIERERRLTHAGTPGDNDEIAGVHARGHLVELLVARGQARNRLAAIGRFMDLLKRPHHDILHVLVRISCALSADRENRRLGLIEKLVDGPVVPVAPGDHLVARENERPDDRFLPDDPRMRLDVRDARDGVAERKQIFVAPDRRELPTVDQRLSKRDVVDRLAAARQLGHRFEDFGVGLAVEVLDGQRLDDDVHRLILEEDPSEDRALCFEGVGGDLAGLLL